MKVSFSFFRSITPILLTQSLSPFSDEAASAWRQEKLRDFVWRARCLGLADDPAVAALLGSIQSQTTDLEELQQRQSQPGYERPWWADGEYDAGRADASNDAGMAAFGSGRHGEAFDCFTEAIRLCPTSAVYHCNRAAAALRLGRPALAAQDAENAAARDPGYLKAHIRAGQAYLKLEEPEKAEESFAKAAELEPGSAAAERGLAQTAALRRRLVEEDAANQAAADAGERPALPRSEIDTEAAAMQLIAADTVLASAPRNEAARCSRAEALILCRRYFDALEACDMLLEGAEKAYLRAEALWRGGDIADALAALGDSEDRKEPTKCTELRQHVQNMKHRLDKIESSIDDGVYLDAIDTCSEALQGLDPGACCGLYRLLLRRRASSYAAQRQWKESLADADAALALQASDAEALRLRADLYKQTGRYLDYFLDIQRLKKVAPDAPGLSKLLEDAARLCAQAGPDGRGEGGGFDGAVVGPPSAFRELGISSGSSAAEVRKAYLKLAAEWHPDKWAAAESEERDAAEERFKKIQAAYEELTMI